MGYKRLQELQKLTMGYIGLQGVASSYKELQEVTTGLKGVTRG